MASTLAMATRRAKAIEAIRAKLEGIELPSSRDAQMADILLLELLASDAVTLAPAPTEPDKKTEPAEKPASKARRSKSA